MTATASLPVQRSSLAPLGSEPWRAAFEFASHKLTRRVVPTGDGHPVVIFPRLAADGHSVAPLQRQVEDIEIDRSHIGMGSYCPPA